MKKKIFKKLISFVFICSLLALGLKAYAATLPNDPLFPQQWYLEKIQMPSAWDITTGTQEIIIAVIDSGFMTNHPDLKNRLWTNTKEIAGNGIDDDGNGFIDDLHGWNFIDNNNDLAPIVDRTFTDYKAVANHGTLIAGLIGAETGNNEGVAGINWNVLLMPLKVLDAFGSSDSGRVAKAIAYAVAQGAKIINLSFVGAGLDPKLVEAMKMAREHGVIMVAAAGNDKTGNGTDLDVNPRYPVCYNEGGEKFVIGVAALDQEDKKARFSNFGKNCVDLSAPGNRIFGTQYVKAEDPEFQNLYGGYWGGTSLAAPLVTGTVALMWAMAPSLPEKIITELLLQNTDSIEAQNPEYSGKLGKGRVNPALALSALRSYLQSLAASRVKVTSFSLENNSATTDRLSIVITIKAENATSLTVTNGNILNSPICNFSGLTPINFAETLAWKIAEGPPGERIVCLKFENNEVITRSIFYSPKKPSELSAPAAVSRTPPFRRDLKKEQEMAPYALRVFKKYIGSKPNSKNPKHIQAWQMMIYNLPFEPRDLKKEQVAIAKFQKTFKRPPGSSFDWSVVRALAYVF
jgi:subtilisin family serine protease